MRKETPRQERKPGRTRLLRPVSVTAVAVLFLSGVAFVSLPGVLKTTYVRTLPAAAELPKIAEAPAVLHLPTPEPLKAIYMTSCVAGTPSFREELIKLIEGTELNAIVIDIKDYTGTLSFVPEDPVLQEFVSKRCLAPDMQGLLKRLHEKGIYTIGRITVFQDPFLASRRPDLAVKKRSDQTTWKDFKGLSFTDPGAKEVWDHTVAIAKESYRIGFDELNFDYIRFPSDGPMSDIAFTWSGSREKSDVLEDFFAYLSAELSQTGAVISADVFGMTTTNTDDLNIGQIQEKISPYFHFLAPMVYPSHYPPRFNGWNDPNKFPYEVIKYSMDKAVARLQATTTSVALRGVAPVSTTSAPVLYPKKKENILKLRPWLQDFDYGGNYDVAEVRAQIQAVYDAGLTSWMLWAPSNRYTRGALLPE